MPLTPLIGLLDEEEAAADAAFVATTSFDVADDEGAGVASEAAEGAVDAAAVVEESPLEDALFVLSRLSLLSLSRLPAGSLFGLGFSF